MTRPSTQKLCCDKIAGQEPSEVAHVRSHKGSICDFLQKQGCDHHDGDHFNVYTLTGSRKPDAAVVGAT